MKWKMGTAIFVVALVAATAGVSLSQSAPGKAQTMPEMKADVTIESGAEGLRIVAEFESGRVEIERRGEPMTVKISGLDIEYASQVVRMLLMTYRETQQTTNQAALESSSEWRRLRDDNKRLEGSLRNAEAGTDELVRRIEDLREELAARDKAVRKLEEQSAKQREVIEYLEAAVKKSRESDG